MLKSFVSIVLVSFILSSCLVSRKKSFSSTKIEKLNTKLTIPDSNSFRLTTENFNNGLKILKNQGVRAYSIPDLGTKIISPNLELLSANTSYCSSARLAHIKHFSELEKEKEESEIEIFDFVLTFHPELRESLKVQGKYSIIVFWSKKYADKINMKHVNFGWELKERYPGSEVYFVNSDIQKE